MAKVNKDEFKNLTAESNVRIVTMDHDLVKTARDIGICLGD